ncbi:MAG: hypothetical protein HLUCCO16_20425 [Phormidium sp. OSCR]|nr:MAG: hypothetical protein HLUCCO16_20425 [Phormidium sp. OSCR]
MSAFGSSPAVIKRTANLPQMYSIPVSVCGASQSGELAGQLALVSSLTSANADLSLQRCVERLARFPDRLRGGHSSLNGSRISGVRTGR